MTAKDAARRLIKSRLRRFIMLGLAQARPDQAWLASAEIEAGNVEAAQADWAAVKNSLGPSELACIIQDATLEASVGVRSAFEGVVDDIWLSQRIREFSTLPGED